MANLIVDTITRFKLKRLFKKLSAQESKFNSFLKENKNVFLILPDSVDELRKSEKVVEFLIEQNKNLTVFNNVDILENFKFKNHCKLIEFTSDKMNKLKLPNDDLVKVLKSGKYPVCINLNQAHTIFNIFVMGLLKSQYRIGFGDGNFDSYFNLLIDKGSNVENDQYLSMISSLKMFS